jgi:hypothetical protein
MSKNSSGDSNTGVDKESSYVTTRFAKRAREIYQGSSDDSTSSPVAECSSTSDSCDDCYVKRHRDSRYNDDVSDEVRLKRGYEVN